MNRIAFLIPTLDQIGGAESQVLLLAKEFSKRGWQVSVIALSGSGILAAAELSACNVNFLSLGMRKAWIDPRGWLRYLAWHRRNQPQIVHAHLPHATWFARCARLLAPIRVLVDTIHTSNTGPPSRRLGYRLTGWLSNQATCVSQSVAAAALSKNMLPANKLTVLPNGVVLPLHNPPTHSSPTSGFHWIAIGRLAPVKDYPTLLRAFAELPRNPELTIAGIGPEEKFLRTLAANLQIEHRVHFAGFHKNIQPLLNAADGFVLSSKWEGLPVSVLEASAAGLPIVATGGPGTREAIIEMTGIQTGILVPVGDAAALSIAMCKVMDMSWEDRIQIGLNGRQFVEKHFSLPAAADQWEKLYGSLLVRHRSPSRWDKTSTPSTIAVQDSPT